MVKGTVGRGEVHVVGEQVRGRDAVGDRQHDASVVGDTGALDHAGDGEHVVGHGEETARLCRIGGEAYMTAGFSVPSGVVMWWFSGVS